MPEDKKASNQKPPVINPYVFPILLAGFGVWCLYDGWLSANPEMQDYRLFNQIASAVLLPWAAYDFWKVRKQEAAEKKEHKD